MDDILFGFQSQYRNSLLLRIDDPVFRNAAASIVGPFIHQVASSILLLATDNFHHEVGPLPEFVVHTIRVLVQHENHVRFANLSTTQPDSQRSEEYASQVVIPHKPEQ